jgi:hypothetical protein
MTARKHVPRRSSSSSKLSLRNHCAGKGQESTSILDISRPVSNQALMTSMQGLTANDDDGTAASMMMGGSVQLTGTGGHFKSQETPDGTGGHFKSQGMPDDSLQWGHLTTGSTLKTQVCVKPC